MAILPENTRPDIMDVDLEDDEKGDYPYVPKSDRGPVDYDGPAYTQFTSSWRGWSGASVRCNKDVLRRYHRWKHITPLDVTSSLDGFTSFLLHPETDIIQTTLQEVSYPPTTSRKSTSRGAYTPTLMYLICEWAGSVGFTGFTREEPLQICPSLEQRRDVHNPELANTLQHDWSALTRFSTPLYTLYELLVRDPLYNYKLNGHQDAPSYDAEYKVRWHSMIRSFGELIRCCSRNYNTIYKWIGLYKHKLQSLSGLSLKPKVHWSHAQIDAMAFCLPSSVDNKLRAVINKRRRTVAETPCVLKIADIKQLRDYLMSYDFSTIEALQKIPSDQQHNMDECMCAAALLVQLLIGSRFIEVMGVSDFYNHDTAGESGYDLEANEILVKGVSDYTPETFTDTEKQAKTILKPKPVLFGYNSKIVIDLVYRCIRPYLTLRMGGKWVPPVVLTRKFNHIAKRIIEKALSNQPGSGRAYPLGCTLLRKIYAVYSYETECKTDISRDMWIQNVLGSSHTGTRSVRSCSAMTVERPTEKSDHVVLAEQSEMRAEIARMQSVMRRMQSQIEKNTSMTQLGSKLAVVDRDGKEVYIDKRKRVHGRQAEQAYSVAIELRNSNVKVTSTLLRKFGYGTKIAIDTARLINRK